MSSIAAAAAKPSLLSKIASKTRSVGSSMASGAKRIGSSAASGAKRLGSSVASGAKRIGSSAASGAKRLGSSVKAALPPPSSFFTSWPMIVLLLNGLIASIGFYMYWSKYNVTKWSSFKSTFPFIANSHLNVVIFILLAFGWLTLYYSTKSFMIGDLAMNKLVGMFALLFFGITQAFLAVYLFSWLFTGASKDSEEDAENAQSAADLAASSSANANKAACTTACAGDRTQTVDTIVATCPDKLCP